MKKQKKQLMENTKNADRLFRESLKVKQQYEEILSQLYKNAEIAPHLAQAIEIFKEEEKKIVDTTPR